jgi:hypothetical protein
VSIAQAPAATTVIDEAWWSLVLGLTEERPASEHQAGQEASRQRQGQGPGREAIRRSDDPGDTLGDDVPGDTLGDEAVLSLLVQARPSPHSIARLSGIDPSRLGPEAGLLYLEALQRHMGWLASLESQALVCLAGIHSRAREVPVRDATSGRERTIVLEDEAREEIAAALHRSPSAVHDQIEQARVLNGPLHRTLTMLQAGDLAPGQARMIAQQALRLTGREVVTGQSPEHDSPDHRRERLAFAAGCEQLQDRSTAPARSSVGAGPCHWSTSTSTPRTTAWPCSLRGCPRRMPLACMPPSRPQLPTEAGRRPCPASLP